MSVLWYGQFFVIIPSQPKMAFDTYLQSTKKSKKFKWTEGAGKAFKYIKELLFSPPVLRAPTPEVLF